MAVGMQTISRGMARGLGVGQGGASRLSDYAGWYFRVYARVHIWRRESSTSWMGGSVVHPLGWGWRGRVQSNATWGARPATPGSREAMVLLRESGTVVPGAAPWRPSHAGDGHASHTVFPKTVGFGGCAPPLWEM